MTNLATVEALQREIDRVTEYKKALDGVSLEHERKQNAVHIAALELAEADATRTLGHLYDCPCVHCEKIVSARIALNEALQR